jgi:hypothetical protein
MGESCKTPTTQEYSFFISNIATLPTIMYPLQVFSLAGLILLMIAANHLNRVFETRDNLFNLPSSLRRDMPPCKR